MDLTDLPIVDNHAHPLSLEQPAVPEDLRLHFTEASDPSMRQEHTPFAAVYRWALRQLGGFLGVEPEEGAILARREPFEEYVRRLVDDANLSSLLLDTGFPPPEQAYSIGEMERMLGVRVERILRLETLVQDLIARHRHFVDVRDAFDKALADIRADGWVALKSIAAYRSGLDVTPVDDAGAERAFGPVRALTELAPLRLADKTLVDYFLWRALGMASRQEVPLQIHTGYGDPDLDLRLANPLHLRLVFEEPRFRGASVVLLHASYPFTAEAAYLAAAYPNAYLDIAFSLPPLARPALLQAVRTAVSVAPATKLMVSSDGTRIPEHYWLGAVRARGVLGEVLEEMVGDGELSRPDALQFAVMILHQNAEYVYRL